MELAPTTDFRAGYIAIVGWPNVGKSTLLNALLGQKLSIVSSKPQTTQRSIRGILNNPRSQLVFVDTPGWLNPSDSLQAFMKRDIARALYDDADVILWVLDPLPWNQEKADFGRRLSKLQKPLIVVINKVDLLRNDDENENAIKQALKDLELIRDDKELLLISAKKNQGVEALKGRIAALLPISPPFFPTDQITDRWERFYAAELLRENIFHLYQDEVPHASAVVVTEFRERPGHKDHIKITVAVESEGQKKILIGEKGRAIKELGKKSREAIEAFLGRPVFLELLIKVRKNWRKDSLFLKELEGQNEP